MLQKQMQQRVFLEGQLDGRAAHADGAGDIVDDNIAEMQANIEKANTAVDVLVTVKNEVLSAYNTIINMQV